METNIIAYLALFLTISQCTNKQRETDLIMGKWVGESTTVLYEDDTINTKANTLQLIFKNDSVYWGFKGSDGYETFTYSQPPNHLIINGEKMELIKLNDSILVYKRKVLVEDNFDILRFRKAEGLDW